MLNARRTGAEAVATANEMSTSKVQMAALVTTCRPAEALKPTSKFEDKPARAMIDLTEQFGAQRGNADR